MAEMSGRCACGAVRWRAPGPVLWAGHCHCESCRRATSSPLTSFFGVSRTSVQWIGKMGEIWSSGRRVRRQFCADCGTQMTYQSETWPEETHLYATTLDNPAAFEPKAHFHYAERVPWLAVADDLPKYEGTAEA